MKGIRIGSRGSPLALAQADWVRRELEGHYPGLKVEIVAIKTTGDRFLSSPIKTLEGKGIFVKEIEEALLRKRVDLAVHSMKDLPTEIPAGLTLAAVSKREDPRDALVSALRRTLRDLPPRCKVGTGSLRRQAQILHFREDLQVVPIRGNIDTRLRKLERGEVGALVVAVAGLRRLGLEGRVSEYLSPDVCLNAVAQGALGLEVREGDPVGPKLAFLHHAGTAAEVVAERAFLKRLGGGCVIPVGALGRAEQDRIRLVGMVGDIDGRRLVRGEVIGPREKAEELGRVLAERLLGEGAAELLAGLPRPAEKKARAISGVQGKRSPMTEERPLSGRRIVITRPRSQAGPFAQGIEALGGEVIAFPTVAILPPSDYRPMDRAIRSIERYRWIIFTSVNGVKRFLDRFRYLGRDLADLEGIRVAAIGPQTATGLESYGLRAELVPREYRAEGILAELKPEEVRGKRVLLPRVAGARDILPRTLREWGAKADVIEAYRTVPAGGDAARLQTLLWNRRVDMLTFTSSSTVRYFVDLFPGVVMRELLNGIAVACIGPVTRQTAQGQGIRVDVVPDQYTIQGLIQAILDYFANMRQ